MNDYIAAVTSKVYFHDKSHVSSSHADLNEGQLVRRKSRYEFSYNAFSPPLVVFCVEGLVIHRAISNKVDGLKSEECLNGRIMYYPIVKGVEIQIDQEDDEEIGEFGMFEFFLKRNLVKCIPNQYIIIPIEGIALKKPKKTKLLQFEEDARLKPQEYQVPDCINQIGLWRDRRVWFLHSKFFHDLLPFIDRDYHSIIKMSEEEVLA